MKHSIYLLLSLVLLLACQPVEKEISGPDVKTEVKLNVNPDWAKNSNIYEVNLRQYTTEGTFNAFMSHLTRLRDMEVDILWFMPIHPISKVKRKGSLGSYYAVSDFKAINPNFGNIDDFKVLVDSIHSLGMHVLIDWVPHHTGWDHPWIAQHPDWFSQDSLGNIIDPINEETGESWGWTDVAELKLDNQEMRKATIEDMIYWLTDVGIDGFRVDHAHGLPADYWNQVGYALGKLGQDVFMLAEGEEGYLRNDSNFVMTYAWHFHHTMNAIALGNETVNKLDSILAHDREEYNFGYHMNFTSNHDENSWAGTVFERMGEGHKAFAVLAHTIDGMPLIYSGQEEPIRKRLEFFEKDPIEWKDYAYADFYKTLLALKKKNRALWNGRHGGQSVRINTSDTVYAFKREKDDDKVVVILNLSSEDKTTSLTEDIENLKNIFNGTPLSLKAGSRISLRPWEYFVFSNK